MATRVTTSSTSTAVTPSVSAALPVTAGSATTRPNQPPTATVANNSPFTIDDVAARVLESLLQSATALGSISHPPTSVVTAPTSGQPIFSAPVTSGSGSAVTVPSSVAPAIAVNQLSLTAAAPNLGDSVPRSMATAPLRVMPPAIPNLPVARGGAPPSGNAALQSSSSSLAISPSFQNALAWMLQSASKCDSVGQGSAARVLIGPGLPTIPRVLLERIQRWEYIDMADLLPSSSADDSALPANGTPARFSLFPGCEIVRSRKRQISSIAEWVQGFAVYIAAIGAKHPSSVNELLAYMLTIIKASQQYDGMYWRAYDTHYRISKAATGNKNWSRLDTDLFTRFFTGRAKLVNACSQCDSTRHSAMDCPHNKKVNLTTRKRPLAPTSAAAPPKRKFKQWPSDVCAEFNARGACSFDERCKYRHVCGECMGEHSAKICPSKAL